jgi:hypothetical protein
MKSNWPAGVLLVATVLLGVEGAWILAEEQKTQLGKLVTDVSIPGVAGKCCLLRLQKTAKDGELDFQLGDPYECRNMDKAMKTASGTAKLQLVLRSGGNPCDELPSLIPDNSVLTAEGTIIRRDDDLAHFIGTFTINAPGANGKVIFKGYVEAIERISTHHPPFGSERCDMPNRLEGWLVGTGQGDATPFTLRALLIADTRPQDGAPKGYKLPYASIDGVLVKCDG